MPIPGANEELELKWIGERTRPRDRELSREACFGEAPKPAREARALPRNRDGA